jgi:hypothetical protein
MSAAATAAGYLYASGRLRGRGAREQEEEQQARPQQARPQHAKPAPREKIRVAVVPSQDEPKPRRAPKVEYRTRRRWTAE